MSELIVDAGHTTGEKQEWIDVWRGILIVGIVIGHTGLVYLTGFFYLFHVAAFFFVSGVLSSFQKYSFNRYAINRAKRLLLPFFSVNLILFGLVYLAQFLDISHYFYSIVTSKMTWLYLFTGDATVDLGGATWFLIVLFLSSVFAYIIYKISLVVDKQDDFPGSLLAMSVIGLLIFYALRTSPMHFPFQLDLALLGAFFLLAGFIAKKQGHIKQLSTLKTKKVLMLMVLAAVFLVIANRLGFQVDWPARKFHWPAIDVTIAFIGIIFSAALAVMVVKIRSVGTVFAELGRASIGILIFHFIYFRLSFVLLYMVRLLPRGQLQLLTPSLITNQFLLLFITVFSLTMSYASYKLLLMNNYTRKFILGLDGK